MSKKIIVFAMMSFIMNHSFAQVLKPAQMPTGQPGKPNLPTPNIHLQPADLEVTTISFVSAEFKTDVKSEYIKVNITVKNSGQIKAPATKMIALFQDAKNNGGWKQFDNNVDIPAIDPGHTYSATCTFKSAAIGTVKNINMYAEADGNRTVTEISETNNASPHILIGL